VAQATPFGSAWQGSLRDLAYIINNIRRVRAFGRLTLRNTARMGLAHLYFRGGRLVHVVGNRGGANITLTDLAEWTLATIRFERGIAMGGEGINAEQERLFDDVLMRLQRRGVVLTPERPRIIESHIVAAARAEQLITPFEWRVLVESTRRVSLAVAHLVGPREAMNVLRDILDDCSSSFPALSGLQIAPSGYLQVTRNAQFDRVPRREILEGFAALITICEYFCLPIIGEVDAHRLIIQALGDVGPALVSLGVFQINRQLLSR